jgi:hypothetical protein
VTVHRDPGALADEAAQFAAAALTWAQRLAGGLGPGGDRIATGSAECTGCPVCRAISALRDPNPEIAEKVTRTVTDLAVTVAAGLRHAFDHHQHGEPADGGPASEERVSEGAGAPEAEPRPGPPAPGDLQHIEIA